MADQGMLRLIFIFFFFFLAEESHTKIEEEIDDWGDRSPQPHAASWGP
jgi:hypothetical protein